MAQPQASQAETPEALKNRGNACMREGRWAQAEAFYRQALALDGQYMPAHYNLGNALRRQGRLDEALDAYRAAAELAPADYEIHNNIGVTLVDLGRADEAVVAFGRAAHCAPDALEPLVGLTTSLGRLGRYAEAISAADRALAIDPRHSMTRYHRSMLYLLLGRFEQGFLEHESRLDLPGAVPEDLLEGREEWEGTELAGRTLLIYPEQGVGDMIQFLRYAPLCKEAGGRVIVVCHRPLAPALAQAQGIDRVVADGDPLPETFDTYVSAMSLPYLFGRRPELPPLRIAASDGVLLPPGTGRRIGICWAGNPSHPRDRERSIPFARFMQAFAGVEGVSLYSLQFGTRAGEAAQRPDIVDLQELAADYADTAALLKQLDLVVSVDTSLVHLAGSLGVPTWLLVTYSPDWRWGVEGEGSAWYPSVRLFRQPAYGDWDAALSRVRRALSEDLSGLP